MKSFIVLTSLLFLFVASPLNADVLITSRSSLLATNIDFGYLGSVTTSTDSLVYTTIDDMQLSRQGAATDGGPLGDVSWDASYQFDVHQQLTTGSSNGFGGSSSTGLFAFAGGEGVCFLASTNRLEVVFENSTPTVFDLNFIATDNSRLDIEHMTGPGIWDSLYANPGGLGEVTMKLPLAAGVFRVTAETVVSTDNSFSNGASWSFSIWAVPEPSSTALLAISAACLVIHSRRNVRE